MTPTNLNADTQIQDAAEKISVPKWLQNELYEKTEPYIEKMIEAHQKENLGFSRFSLNNIALHAAVQGYYHAIPNPPENKKEVQPPTPEPELSVRDKALDWWCDVPEREAAVYRMQYFQKKGTLSDEEVEIVYKAEHRTPAAAKEEDTVGGEIEKQVYKIDIFQSESILGNDFLKVTDVLKPRFVGGIVYCEGDSITINNMADVAKYNGVGKKKMELKSTLFLSKESLITLLNKL